MRVNYTKDTEVIDLDYIFDYYESNESYPSINLLGIRKLQTDSTEFSASLVNVFNVIKNRLPNRTRIETSLSESDFTPDNTYVDGYGSSYVFGETEIDFLLVDLQSNGVNNIDGKETLDRSNITKLLITWINQGESYVQDSILCTCLEDVLNNYSIGASSIILDDYVFKLDAGGRGVYLNKYKYLGPFGEDLFNFNGSSDAYNGDNLLVDEEYIYKVLPISIKNKINFRGIQGPKSTLQGIQGPEGNSGELTGTQGTQGIQGLQGLQGTQYFCQGYTGYKGTQGPRGTQGYTGKQGSTKSVQTTTTGGISTYSDEAIDLVITKFTQLTGIRINLSRSLNPNTRPPNIVGSTSFSISKNISSNASIYSASGFYKD